MRRARRDPLETLINNIYHLDRKRTIDYRMRSFEEFQKHLTDRIEKINRLIYDSKHDEIIQYSIPINQVIDVNKDEIRHVMHELNSLWGSFTEGLLMGLSNIIANLVERFLNRVLIGAYIKLKFKSAWTWRGWLAYFYFDKLYITLTDKYEDIIKSLLMTCKYANRTVELLEGLESYCKAYAHEYLSYLRRLKCHLSQVSIKLTPVTMRVAHNERGTVFSTININARTLTYSPYSRRIYALPPHYSIILRRKPDINFSSRINGGTIIVGPDANIITAKDLQDRAYAVRKLLSLAINPRILLKDKARSLGMPEQWTNIDACSVYFIPRVTKTAKLEPASPTMKILSKRHIYSRMAKV